jgi:hypothetical protein
VPRAVGRSVSQSDPRNRGDEEQLERPASPLERLVAPPEAVRQTRAPLEAEPGRLLSWPALARISRRCAALMATASSGLLMSWSKTMRRRLGFC